MNNAALKLVNLTKAYGKFRGIENVDLTVEKGKIFGFLGPNGAGKSTAIRVLVNFLRPTSGQATILGLDSVKDSVEINKRTGYLAGDFAMYDNLTGRQYLEFIANMRGVSGYAKKVAKLTDFFDAQLDKKISTLSRGNAQKIGLIGAIFHEPELLILDEPTTGLDPLMQNRFYQLVHDFTKKGGTVFMSSHILSEVQEVCDHVAFMKNGRLIDVVDVQKYLHDGKKEVSLRFNKSSEVFDPGPKNNIQILKQSKNDLRFITNESSASLISRLSKYKIDDVTIQDVSIDEVFLRLYGAGSKDMDV